MDIFSVRVFPQWYDKTCRLWCIGARALSLLLLMSLLYFLSLIVDNIFVCIDVMFYITIIIITFIIPMNIKPYLIAAFSARLFML